MALAISGDLKRLEDARERLDAGAAVGEAKTMLERVKALVGELDRSRNYFFALGHILGNLEEARRKQKDVGARLEEAKSKLPSICPMCGQPVEVCHDR